MPKSKCLSVEPIVYVGLNFNLSHSLGVILFPISGSLVLDVREGGKKEGKGGPYPLI